MSSDSVRQLSNSFPNIPKTHIRFVVKDKVRTQVVNSNDDKIIREIPRNLSSSVLSVYAWFTSEYKVVHIIFTIFIKIYSQQIWKNPVIENSRIFLFNFHSFLAFTKVLAPSLKIFFKNGSIRKYFAITYILVDNLSRNVLFQWANTALFRNNLLKNAKMK